MRRLLLLLLAGLAPAAVADEGAAARIEGYLQGLEALRAEFRQTVTDPRGRVVERAEGTVALARPGRFRWDYRVPEQLIVSDGRQVWLYDVGLEQVTVREAGPALAGTPAALLAGTADLSEAYTIIDGGRRGRETWAVLRPRGESDFTELRLGFAGGELRLMRLADRLGQMTELEFLRLERNPRLDESLFRFTPPPGVDVVASGSGR